MKTLYVLSGIPGSGKTTLAKSLEERLRAKRHSYDDFPNARGNPDKDGAILKSYYAAIKDDLKNGYDVVVDDGNLTILHRLRMLEEFKDIPCKKIIMIMETPLDVCIKRNEMRQGVEKVREVHIRLAHEVMERPSSIEGWDAIYAYTEVG